MTFISVKYRELHLRYFYSYLLHEFILRKNTYVYIYVFLRKINECIK